MKGKKFARRLTQLANCCIVALDSELQARVSKCESHTLALACVLHSVVLRCASHTMVAWRNPRALACRCRPSARRRVSVLLSICDCPLSSCFLRTDSNPAGFSLLERNISSKIAHSRHASKEHTLRASRVRSRDHRCPGQLILPLCL